MDKVWIKTTQYIHAGEELLIQYDTGWANAYWGPMYSHRSGRQILYQLTNKMHSLVCTHNDLL